jgi:hypothetical protein
VQAKHKPEQPQDKHQDQHHSEKIKDNGQANLKTEQRMAQTGKLGLTKQLQTVGRKGFELQRSKLLESLASFKNDKDAA